LPQEFGRSRRRGLVAGVRDAFEQPTAVRVYETEGGLTADISANDPVDKRVPSPPDH
jgi:hypothetical protein